MEYQQDLAGRCLINRSRRADSNAANLNVRNERHRGHWERHIVQRIHWSSLDIRASIVYYFRVVRIAVPASFVANRGGGPGGGHVNTDQSATLGIEQFRLGRASRDRDLLQPEISKPAGYLVLDIHELFPLLGCFGGFLAVCRVLGRSAGHQLLH